MINNAARLKHKGSMERRNTENSSQINMVETSSSNMKACHSQCDTQSPVCSPSIMTSLDRALVEAVFIKEERVWDDSESEVRVKEENEEYDMREVLPLEREWECAISQEVHVKKEIELNFDVNKVCVKEERVWDCANACLIENVECLGAEKEREQNASMEDVHVKQENKRCCDKEYVSVEIEGVRVKEEGEWDSGAAEPEHDDCEVVFGPAGPQPQDIVFAMRDRDKTLALNQAVATLKQELSQAEEHLMPTCSIRLEPDSIDTRPKAFDLHPSIVRSTRTTVQRKARTDQRTCTCDYCGKQFVRKTNLVAHIRIHMGIKRYCCKICDKVYTSLYNLTRHKLIHTGLKPYSCELCEKRFTDPCNLVIHRETHKERKTFSCKICNKQFKQNHSLKSHRRVHTGDRPFSCEICERSFSNPSNLKRHYRVHTGEKPHECKFCKKRYVDLRDLTKHERNHTDTPVP